MIFGKKPTEPTQLEKEIERVIAYISTLQPDSDEYKLVNKQLKELHAMQEAEKPKQLDPNNILLASANIAGIVLIVGHERAHVITSKAVGFVRTLR
jgi:hypothetical protein